MGTGTATTPPPSWSVPLPFTLLSWNDCTVPPAKLMPLPLPEMRLPPSLVVEATDLRPFAFDSKVQLSTSAEVVLAPTFRPESVLKTKYEFDTCKVHAVDVSMPLTHESRCEPSTVTSTPPPTAVLDA